MILLSYKLVYGSLYGPETQKGICDVYMSLSLLLTRKVAFRAEIGLDPGPLTMFFLADQDGWDLWPVGFLNKSESQRNPKFRILMGKGGHKQKL